MVKFGQKPTVTQFRSAKKCERTRNETRTGSPSRNKFDHQVNIRSKDLRIEVYELAFGGESCTCSRISSIVFLCNCFKHNQANIQTPFLITPIDDCVWDVWQKNDKHKKHKNILQTKKNCIVMMFFYSFFQHANIIPRHSLHKNQSIPSLPSWFLIFLCSMMSRDTRANRTHKSWFLFWSLCGTGSTIVWCM